MDSDAIPKVGSFPNIFFFATCAYNGIDNVFYITRDVVFDCEFGAAFESVFVTLYEVYA